MEGVLVPVSDLFLDPRNARKHPQRNLDAIRSSLERYEQATPILVRKETQVVISGNGTLQALRDLGRTHAWVVYRGGLTDAEAADLALRYNRSAELAEWDDPVLIGILRDLGDADIDIAEGGWSEEDFKRLLGQADPPPPRPPSPKLTDRFIVPPFSVLDTRQGYWQDRKREWMALGIASEVGRGDRLTFGEIDAERFGSPDMVDGRKKDLTWGSSPQMKHPTMNHYREQNSRAAADERSNLTGAPPTPEWADIGMTNMAPGTSIFDPVLCEIAYRWFAPRDGTILDPFAGGSVRGIVAASLGYDYTGIDLRPEQVASNEEQRAGILPDDRQPAVRWVVGDSKDAETLLPPDTQYDLIFSCPPYGDLEVYSDDPADLSTMDHDTFLGVYEDIILAAVDRLRDDRFAVFVVGDFRDKRGFYRNFVSATIKAFEAAGAWLYNEAILVNVAGTLPIRVGRQFSASRKLGKTHQNVLVFFKGDPKTIAKNLGSIDVVVPDPE